MPGDRSPLQPTALAGERKVRGVTLEEASRNNGQRDALRGTRTQNTVADAEQHGNVGRQRHVNVRLEAALQLAHHLALWTDKWVVWGRRLQ